LEKSIDLASNLVCIVASFPELAQGLDVIEVAGLDLVVD
jgi:hypothetical protein